MKQFNQFIRPLLLLSIIFFTQITKADVNVSISNQSVMLGEMFNIRFSYKGGSLVKSPDFTPLNEYFQVLNITQSRSSSIQIINGVRTEESKSEFTLTVIAKEQGIITIPQIAFNGDLSRPQVIQVAPNPALSKDNFFIEINQSKNDAYVFEQFKISYTFYFSESVANSQFTPPRFEGVEVDVIELDQTQGQVQKNSRVYGFVTQDYLVTAKQSGTLNISPFTFSGIINGSKQLRVFTESDPIKIEINRIPNNINANHWFPARNLKISEQYSSNSSDIELGTPITREIELSASFVGNNQVPQLNFDSVDGLNVYPDSQDINQNGVNLVMKQAFTLIASKEGKITIPEMRFSWWDLDNNQMQTSTLPKRVINVIAPSQSQLSNQLNNQASSPQNNLNNNPQSLPLANQDTSDFQNQIETQKSRDSLHWLVYLLVSLLVLSLLALLFLRQKIKKLTLSQKGALSPISHQKSHSKSIEVIGEAEKIALEIKNHLKENRLSEVRADLIKLCKVLCNHKTEVQALDDLIGDQFATIRHQIDANLYNNKNYPLDSKAFIDSINQYLKKHKTELKNEKKPKLAKLN